MAQIAPSDAGFTMRRSIRGMLLRLWLGPRIVRWVVIGAIVLVMLASLGWAPMRSGTDRGWYLWQVWGTTNWRPCYALRADRAWTFSDDWDGNRSKFEDAFYKGDLHAAMIRPRPSSIYVGLIVPWMMYKQRIATVSVEWAVPFAADDTPRSDEELRDLLHDYATMKCGDATASRFLPAGGDYEFRWLPEGIAINAIWIIGAALLAAIAYVRYKHAHVIYRNRIRNIPVPERRCTRCGYSLEGLRSGPCPECGWTMS